jgi:hypothetical protein
MSFRNTLGAAALVAAAVIGCSGRDDSGSDGGPDNGCTGACNQNDGGTNLPDGGVRACPAADSQGRGPIGILRATGTQGQAVTLEHVVVTAVDDLNRGSQGDYIAQFWVVDPCFPKEGIWVDKFYDDLPKAYAPQLGDELKIQGVFRRINRVSSDVNLSSSEQTKTRNAYRPAIKSSFGLPGASVPLILTKTGTVQVPQDVPVPANFGNANGGATKANPEHGGARVHIPGPIDITHADPLALKQRPDAPEHGGYLGFEVTGGVLVSNYKTFGVTFDGGTPRCDWRAIVKDGGGVNFPNGIRGVWDTYSHVPCADGGFTLSDGGTRSTCANASRDAGYVPGTNNDYTYILYPQDCATDLPGVVGGP